ncbi:hypothetical protein D3C80_985520 [compost metagenome]
MPSPSVATQVTKVIPLLNSTPLREVPVPVVAPLNANVKLARKQLSVAEAFQDIFGTVYLQADELVTTDLSVVQETTGGIVSGIVVTLAEVEVVQPCASVMIT